MGGDGLLGAIAGELRGTDGVLGVLPGGRGNDFARKLGIGTDPDPRVRAARRRPRDARSTSPTPAARRTSGSRRRGSTPTCRIIANATRDPARRDDLRLRHAARAARAGATRDWEVVVDGEALGFTGYSVAVANSGVFGGGMYLVPGRAARRRAARRRAAARLPAAAVPRRTCRRVFRGHARRQPRPHVHAARARSRSAPSRPYAAYADGDPIADLPVTIRVVPARAEGARPVTPARTQGGRRQGGRDARARRRPRRRDVAARQGAHAPGAARDRAAGAAAAARQRRDQRHERQDDDGRDDRRRSSSAPARRSSTTGRARTWPAAWPPRSPPRRAAAAAR